jgi:hypothetical protein
VEKLAEQVISMSESISSEQLKRLVSDFKKFSKDEKIEVEETKGVVTALGSELGVTRIWVGFNKTKNDKRTNLGFSKNLGKWFFSLRL